jgi:hypothetical protein
VIELVGYIILISIIVTQEIIHFIERRDMYNRLMSKNLTEYNQGKNPPKHIPSAHRKVLNKWRSKVGDE